MNALSKACDEAGCAITGVRPIDYGFQLAVMDGRMPVTVNVYGGRKGVKVIVNGVAGGALQAAVNRIVAQLPSAGADTSSGSGPAPGGESRQADRFPAGPWIGSDESGKGDYFGPLVAAAVYVAPHEAATLREAGVRDSKALTNGAARRVATVVRRLCAGRFAEWVVEPAEYNARYADSRAQKENLNHLLASGHVHVLEALLTAGDLPGGTAATVIADQFADERYVRERLQQAVLRRGLPMPVLIQTPRAEANVAVAAASVLARDRFLGWLEEAAGRYGSPLPKGGSNPAIIAAARRLVERYGPAELANVAKLHFATTKAVGSRQ